MGWSIADRMRTSLVTDAIEMAVAARGGRVHGVVSYTDRGARADSTGRRNTLISEVCDVATADWSLKTSDVPAGRRRQWRAFWQLIATGVTTVEASLAVGVSWPVGARWFRHAGGMPPISLAEPSGRYLTFEEREEIAILMAMSKGVRDIAPALGRDPGTISRELRRNAATRGGMSAYTGTWPLSVAARTRELRVACPDCGHRSARAHIATAGRWLMSLSGAVQC